MTNTMTFNEQLYLNHFNLSGNPFPVAPDDRHFFFTPDVEKLVAELVHGFMSRKGFMVLSGDVGLGKTTLCRRILSILDDNNIKTALVLNTSCQGVALLKQIIDDFGIKTNPGDDTRSLMNTLFKFLIAENKQGNNCAIIIDDAQNLDNQSLEMVRMISNLEADTHKLVQILLSGQTELIESLNSFNLRQLKSRIIISGEASPLKHDEVEQYIRFKLNAAGNSGRITFDKKTFHMIFRFTGGNIRRINILMDRVLYAAFLYSTLHISKQIVKASINDLTRNDKKARRPWLKIIAPVAALVIVGILYIFFPPLNNFLPAKAHKAFPPAHKITASQPGTQPTKTGPQMHLANTKKDTLSPSVSRFLRHYHLDEYAIPFSRALAFGELGLIKDTIFRETGKQLITFTSKEQIPKADYGLLKYKLPHHTALSYFLFWTPEFTINKFYYLYAGNEIKQLQQALAAFNLYTDDIDGVVGKHVMTGVSQFQKNNQIDVTGFPTAKTIFLLCSQRKELIP